MAYTVPTKEPSQLRVGDTWQWRREDLSDYPASVWTLTYYFRNSAYKFDVAAAADGNNFSISIAKATTATRTAGWYDWVAIVTDATDRHQVDSGRVELLANVALDVVADLRTFARRMLDSIEDALENRATTDQLDLVKAQLGERGLERDRGGMLKLRQYFIAEVAAEDRARLGIKNNRILAVG